MKSLLALPLLMVTSCDSFCSTGPSTYSKTAVQGTPTPTPEPTPTPTPSATPTPDPCRIESMEIKFMDGSTPYLFAGAPNAKQLDLTPYNSSGQVAKTCNLTRTPAWEAKTPTICKLVGGGYNPTLEGVKVGSCSIEATLYWDNKPVPATFSPEVR